MVFKVIITRRARGELKSIKDFITRDNPQAAEKLTSQLLEEALSLETNPTVWRNIPLRKPYRKKWVSGTVYLIYYRVDESKELVYVVHFWHGARQSPRLK